MPPIQYYVRYSSRGKETRRASEQGDEGSVRWTDVLIGGAFFLSGVASLIHEVTWTRLLRLVMGNTTLSITTVLCVFMAGLALGSYVGGQIADRRRDVLRLFAILEGAIGLYCFMLPWMVGVGEPIYQFVYQGNQSSFYTLSLLRFAFCGVLLLIPATLMGATLPLLTRFYVRASLQFGRTVGRLYAVNTLGAALGACLVGFVLIPNLGVSSTITLGCLINGLVCFIGFLVYTIVPRLRLRLKELKHLNVPKTGLGPRYAPGVLIALLVGYGCAGAAAMVYEIAWTRALSLIIGPSVYAFSIMLTAFILGLAAGAMVCARFIDRIRQPLLVLAAIELAIGFAALSVVPVFDRIPLFVARLMSQFGESFWMIHIIEFVLVLLIMLVPTTLMGAAFPLANQVFRQKPDSIGRSVGTVYGASTLGSILGAFMGGFVLMPLLGIQHTIFAAVSINALIGCWFLCLSPSLTPRSRKRTAAAVVVAAIIGMVWISPWDASVMSLGPFEQARYLPLDAAESRQAIRKVVDDTTVLFHKEGITSTVTVTRDPKGVLRLLTNGRTEATSEGGQSQQKLLAHLPLLLHPDPRHVLNIGLASGITLGAAGRHPVESLDCVELSKVVIEATRLFDDYNDRILDDPRVNIIVNDGRNHLAMSSKKYDVIISQPSDPFSAGVADLFTQEFFELCRQRLKPGGVTCIWMKAATIDPMAFASVVRTFAWTFNDVTIWDVTRGTEYLLIGSATEFAVDLPTLALRMRRISIAEDLEEIRIRNVPELLRHLAMEKRGATHFAAGGELHTDDNSLLEFAAPRSAMTKEGQQRLFEAIAASRQADLEFLAGPETTVAAARKEATRLIEAKGHVLRASIFFATGRVKETTEALRQAASLNPDDEGLVEYLQKLSKTATRFVAERRPAQAINVCRRLVHIDPKSAKFHFNLASLYRDGGYVADAMTHYARTAQLAPNHVLAHYNLAKLAAAYGQPALAIEHYRHALRVETDFAPAMNNLAWLLATYNVETFRDPDEAVRLAEKACGLTDHKDPDLLDTLSVAYEAADRLAEARSAAEQALRAALAEGKSELAADLRRRLERYEPKAGP